MVFKDDRDLLAKGTVNHLIYHELGHACRQARRSRLPNWFFSRNVSEEDLDKDFNASFPEGAWQCLKSRESEWGGLTKEQRNFRAGEIFADFIFFGGRKNTLDFYHLCNSGEDFAHPAPRKYMDCYLKTPEAKAQLCPNSRKDVTAQVDQQLKRSSEKNQAGGRVAERTEKDQLPKTSSENISPTNVRPGIDIGGGLLKTGSK